MKKYKKYFENQNDIKIPKIGEEILTGKFRNRSEIVKGYEIDENNQPIIVTNKKKRKLFPFRLKINM